MQNPKKADQEESKNEEARCVVSFPQYPFIFWTPSFEPFQKTIKEALIYAYDVKTGKRKRDSGAPVE